MKELTYDGASRVKQIKYSKDSETLIQLDYRFDPSNNITRRTETRRGQAPVEYGYFYDELSQLIRVDINGRTVSRYEYDPAGNRLKKEFAINRYAMQTLGGLKGNLKFDTIEYAYDAANQIISAGDTVFRHDMNGNMIEKIETWNGTDESGSGADSGRTSTKYSYNRADRLWKITLPDGIDIRNYYDFDGLRTAKTAIDGRTTKYYWDVNASIPVVLSERDGLSNPLSSCAYDGFSPLLFKAMEPGNQSFSTAENRYYLNDHLSSILALSNEEAIITDQYDYDEYGIPVIKKADSRNNYGYTGQDYDERTGLLYLRARHYEPELGRFLRVDPIYMNNNFSYIPFGNSIKNNDPSGYLTPGGGIAAILTLILACIELKSVYDDIKTAKEIAEQEWFQKTQNYENSSTYDPNCDKSDKAKEEFIKKSVENSLGRNEIFQNRKNKAEISCGIGVVIALLVLLKL